MATSLRIVEILLLAALSLTRVESWIPDVVPRLYIKMDAKLPIFFGNTTDYFKLLVQDDHSMLIGARNNVYNVSLINLTENRRQRVEWISSDAHRELCALKGKHETDCQNYIRVYARLSNHQIMICGTNSYKPLCRYYTKDISQDDAENSLHGDETLFMTNEIEAQGRCPYTPTHNSTYLFTNGQLYSATVADFSGADPLIYRETQRTEQYDLKQLNQPDFVSTVERDGFVFFFFREIAMEYMNCGKMVYSRVARVCKNDRGGPYKFSDRWTSFLKARLNCSVPGEYPFYFDNIQSTSSIIEGMYDPTTSNRQAIIYAVFTTAENAIPGSAICAFRVADILDAFEGRFKSQRDSISNWLPIAKEAVPEPRPGKCVEDSRTLPTLSVNFIKTHTLMETAVRSMQDRPILTRVNLKHSFTAITVDPQIGGLDGNFYDVIFVGTNDGRIIKLVNIITKNGTSEPTVITETQVLGNDQSVRELSISKATESLIVIGNGQIVSVPLYHCNKIVHCRDCVHLQDPYCAWDIRHRECTAFDSSSENTKAKPINFIQKLQPVKVDLCKKHGELGISEATPNVVATRGTLASVGRAAAPEFDNEISVTLIDGGELTNEINRIDIVDNTLLQEELAGFDNGNPGNLRMGSPSMIVIACVLFVAGITAGVVVARLRQKFSPCYNEHRNQINAYVHKPRHLQALNSAKDINLLANPYSCHPKKENLEQEFATKDRSHECKNSTENLEKDVHLKAGLVMSGLSGGHNNMGTLQKCKKTYL